MMLIPSVVFVVLLVQVFNLVGARTCLSGCTITGLRGQPLNMTNHNCSMATGNACYVAANFGYHSDEYTVTFDTYPMLTSSRFVFALPTNHLSYFIKYACSNNDTCALEFARAQVLDLTNRSYSSGKLSAELAPILNGNVSAERPLVCFDNETCTDGVCKIEYDTKSGLQRARRCETTILGVSAFAYDSDTHGAFQIQCTRPRCNSPETLNKVKMIFAAYKLTNDNGTVPGQDFIAPPSIFGPISAGYGVVAPMFLIVGLSFMHGLLF